MQIILLQNNSDFSKARKGFTTNGGFIKFDIVSNYVAPNLAKAFHISWLPKRYAQ